MIEDQKEQQEYLARQYPMIATPCYGGLVHEPYMRGMTSLAGTATGIGMGVNMATVVNESLVTRARNELVKYLTMTDCTHLFFIDADISFTPADVFRTLLHDKDVVVGAYPLKKIRWDLVDTTKARDVKDILLIEAELNRIQSEIDSMEARMRVLKDQIQMSTIRVALHQQVPPKPATIYGPLGYLYKGAEWFVIKLFVIRE